MAAAQTMFDRIWRRHAVIERPDGYTLLYIDRQLLHDGSWQGFEKLRQRGIKLRRPDRHFATPDHFTSTAAESLEAIEDPVNRRVVDAIVANTAREGVALFGIGDPRRGIAHVVGPEQGITRPGLTIVCGDSHTSTHGALGALAFGIGASEVSHVMATQTLWQKRPKTMRIAIDGRIGAGVTAKDIILAIIARIGAGGAVGHVIEYAGSAIRALGIEGRLTLCNMSIEAGGRAGMVAPDETTYAYLEGRPFAPKGDQWGKALAFWKGLPSDPGAGFDREVSLDGGDIAPMVTWGNSPEDALPITGTVPDPASFADPVKQEGVRRALDYMGLKAGQKLTDIAVDRVFIGSCTNGRLEDLRAAAAVVKGRKATVRAWAVPGSGLVKRAAEAEGLDRIFRDAGFEWREPGCSMCVGMNGDTVDAGQRCASTSNRNFVGRQGPGARTHLMSPAMAAAAAITGRFTDVRSLGVA